MLGMLKRHEVEILLRAGHGKSEVARLAGVSLCSVKRIAAEEPVANVDDAAEPGDDRLAGPVRWRLSGNRCSSSVLLLLLFNVSDFDCGHR
jgi:hypothetical protein